MRSGNKETRWPTSSVFSADLNFFPPYIQLSPISCIKANVCAVMCDCYYQASPFNTFFLT